MYLQTQKCVLCHEYAKPRKWEVIKLKKRSLPTGAPLGLKRCWIQKCMNQYVATQFWAGPIIDFQKLVGSGAARWLHLCYGLEDKNRMGSHFEFEGQHTVSSILEEVGITYHSWASSWFANMIFTFTQFLLVERPSKSPPSEFVHTSRNAGSLFNGAPAYGNCENVR